MSAPVKSVMISPIFPDCTGNGLAMRMGVFAEAMARLGPLVVIVLPVAGSPAGGNDFLRRLGVSVRVLDVASRSSAHFALLSKLADPAARMAAFRAYGQPSLSRGLTPPLLAEIGLILEQERPDLVHIGRSYLSPCASMLRDGMRASLDLDEDDQASFQQQAKIARAAGGAFRAAWLEQEGRACDALVKAWAARFEHVFASSAAEAMALTRRHGLAKVSPIENAISTPAHVSRREDPARLLFVGSLSYAPNADGMIWFLERVLPRLRARRLQPVLVDIVGSMAPARLLNTRLPNVRLHGFVPSLQDMYRRATIAIAPLHAGGGTRIKLLEASAHGLASVATSAANAGLGYDVGWTADSPEAFADSVAHAISDPVERRRRALRARRHVMRHLTRDAVMRRIQQALTGPRITSDSRTRRFV